MRVLITSPLRPTKKRSIASAVATMTKNTIQCSASLSVVVTPRTSCVALPPSPLAPANKKTSGTPRAEGLAVRRRGRDPAVRDDDRATRLAVSRLLPYGPRAYSPGRGGVNLVRRGGSAAPAHGARRPVSARSRRGRSRRVVGARSRRGRARGRRRRGVVRGVVRRGRGVALVAGVMGPRAALVAGGVVSALGRVVSRMVGGDVGGDGVPMLRPAVVPLVVRPPVPAPSWTAAGAPPAEAGGGRGRRRPA